jgi:hypothetical protein
MSFTQQETLRTCPAAGAATVRNSLNKIMERLHFLTQVGLAICT